MLVLSTMVPANDSKGSHETRKPRTRSASKRLSKSVQPCADDSIRNNLLLANEGAYKEFYSIIEHWLDARGWISYTFRSLTQKETVQQELSCYLLRNRETRVKFPKTNEAIGATTG